MTDPDAFELQNCPTVRKIWVKRDKVNAQIQDMASRCPDLIQEVEYEKSVTRELDEAYDDLLQDLVPRVNKSKEV
ncbi:MAG: hypothetical protein V2I33_22615 [Kangiellaceae bacterium]|jgi:hypothetical protein|nr:hypothetical protein [Kangiellaceae bacterium]